MLETNINLAIFFFNKIRKTLFLNLYNTIITLLIILLVSVASIHAFEWLIFKANWKVVISNLPLYAFGSFPTDEQWSCLLYTSPSPRDQRGSRMPSSA